MKTEDSAEATKLEAPLKVIQYHWGPMFDATELF